MADEHTSNERGREGRGGRVPHGPRERRLRLLRRARGRGRARRPRRRRAAGHGLGVRLRHHRDHRGAALRRRRRGVARRPRAWTWRRASPSPRGRPARTSPPWASSSRGSPSADSRATTASWRSGAASRATWGAWPRRSTCAACASCRSQRRSSRWSTPRRRQDRRRPACGQEPRRRLLAARGRRGDVRCLATVSPELFRDSCGEVIKHAVLADAALLDELTRAPLTAAAADEARLVRVVARKRRDQAATS